MLIQETDVITRKAGVDIPGAIDLTLNAVLLLEKGTGEKEVIPATADQSKNAIEGAVESIGPGNANAIQSIAQIITNDTRGDAVTGDLLGVRRIGAVPLVLAKSQTIKEKDPLASAGNGQVKKATISSTTTAAEQAAIIAYAQEDMTTDASAEKAIEAELALGV